MVIGIKTEETARTIWLNLLVTPLDDFASGNTGGLVGRTVDSVEQELILDTLSYCLGNRTHAANILGISIRTLRNKLNEYSADGAPIPPPHGGEMRGAA